MKTVHEVAELTGVSVRTLHYYDEIGLLPPSEVTQAGYRLYGDAEIEKLQHILFLRELDFPLKEIAALLEQPSYAAKQAMRAHKELLLLKRDRLNGLIELAEKILKGETEMSFKEFDMTEIEKARETYRDEVLEKWGNSDAFRESEEKACGYSRGDWERINREAEQIYAHFAENMNYPPRHPKVQAAVKEWQEHITKNYYRCTNEILAGLGEMYAADERFRQNINKRASGLAEFMSEAIRVYCGK